MASLLSVNVGMPADVSWQGQTVRTGIWKRPVPGPRMVRRLNVDGDGQGDLAGHGGEMRAVLVYQIQSYDYWQRYLKRDDFSYGQFGENLTVDGMPDHEVCIGDRYRIGEAEFEVTQPRVTCYRIGLRMGEPAMPSLLVNHHRPGFYMRVIIEGHVGAGDEIVKTGTGPGELSVADTDALLYLPGHDPARLRTALSIPALSPGWQGSFRDLLAAADSGENSQNAPAVKPGWIGFRPLRVTRIVPETATVASICLASDDGLPLPEALPGQYLTLRVAAGEPPPVRNYSLSSAPGAGTYRISVKHEPHGLVSGYLHSALREGAVIDAAAPRGGFVLEDGTGPVVLISAGIGVTPVLAMLHKLAARKPQREVWWLHAARNPGEHALAVEARDLLATLHDARARIFYSAASEGESAGDPRAVIGRLTAGRLAELGIPLTATAYICGPAAFMAAMSEALTGLGIAAGRVRTELFGALPTVTPGVTAKDRPPPHQPPGPPGRGPLVTFTRSGLSARYDPDRGSLLDLADACDVPTRWSCRAGVCHTCVTPVLSGDVDYSPDPLEPPSAGEILPCCARPRTDLVLDM
jgi:ferredoxin-NADP reductase/MOSC domain-containing protein YiiM